MNSDAQSISIRDHGGTSVAAGGHSGAQPFLGVSSLVTDGA